MSEFEVGDKVEHVTAGTCDVLHGPFETRWNMDVYLLGMEDGTAFQATDSEITPPKPAFAVGDKVRYEGTLAELAGGPVVGATSGEELFLLKFLEGPDAGKGMARKASKLEPVTEPALVPVGTRVRIDRAAYASETHGMVGVITDNDADWTPSGDAHHPYRVKLGGGTRTIWAAEVTPVDDEPADGFEYKGVVYEYGVTYEDREGDLFKFRSRRSDDGTDTPEGRVDFAAPDDWNWSLAEVVRDYGPIVKQQ